MRGREFKHIAFISQILEKNIFKIGAHRNNPNSQRKSFLVSDFALEGFKISFYAKHCLFAGVQFACDANGMTSSKRLSQEAIPSAYKINCARTNQHFLDKIIS